MEDTTMVHGYCSNLTGVCDGPLEAFMERAERIVAKIARLSPEDFGYYCHIRVWAYVPSEGDWRPLPVYIAS